MNKQLILFLNFIFPPPTRFVVLWLAHVQHESTRRKLNAADFFFPVPKQQANNGNKYYKVESFLFIRFIYLKYNIEHFFSISSFCLPAWLLKAALLCTIWLWQSLKHTSYKALNSCAGL